jgi:hypothetical protein
MDVVSEQNPSGEKITSAFARFAILGIDTSYHHFHSNGCLA